MCHVWSPLFAICSCAFLFWLKRFLEKVRWSLSLSLWQEARSLFKLSFIWKLFCSVVPSLFFVFFVLITRVENLLMFCFASAIVECHFPLYSHWNIVRFGDFDNRVVLFCFAQRWNVIVVQTFKCFKIKWSILFIYSWFDYIISRKKMVINLYQTR